MLDGRLNTFLIHSWAWCLSVSSCLKSLMCKCSIKYQTNVNVTIIQPKHIKPIANKTLCNNKNCHIIICATANGNLEAELAHKLNRDALGG